MRLKRSLATLMIMVLVSGCIPMETYAQGNNMGLDRDNAIRMDYDGISFITTNENKDENDNIIPYYWFELVAGVNDKYYTINFERNSDAGSTDPVDLTATPYITDAKIFDAAGNELPATCAPGETTVLKPTDKLEKNKVYYIQAFFSSNAQHIYMTIPGERYIRPTKSWEITYNLNGGTGTAPVDSEWYFSSDTLDYYGVYSPANDPTAPAQGSMVAPAGATFAGWKDGTGKVYAAGDKIASTTDVVLYAQWTIPSSSADANSTVYTIDDVNHTVAGGSSSITTEATVQQVLANITFSEKASYKIVASGQDLSSVSNAASAAAKAGTDRIVSGDRLVVIAENGINYAAYTITATDPPTAPTIGTLAISSDFTAGNSITLGDLTKYIPTVTANSTTITAQGWQSSVTSGGSDSWTTWTVGGVLPVDTSRTFKLRYYVIYDGTTVTSNEVTLKVVGNATTLALAASPASPQSTGTPITLTATLTGFFAGPGVKDQTITFKNGSAILGTAALNAGGVATYNWTPDSAGTYSLAAEYAATAYNTAATSSAIAWESIAAATAPTLTAGAVNRINDTTATVKFTSDEGGTYYYNIGSAVTNTSTNGTSFSAGETTIYLTDLTPGAKDIYIVAKDAEGNQSPNTFKITIPAAVPVTNYNISVGDVQVTSANAGKVTGDGITGTVTYDPTEGILTFNNATITKMNGGGNAIYSSSNLKIVLIGKNTIRIWDGSSSINYLAGINVNGELRIESTSGGSISVYNTLGKIENYGIKATSGITIEGCTVNAAGGMASGKSVGIVVTNGNLYIKNATVTADSGTSPLNGSSYGIDTRNGSLDIDNSIVTATGDVRALNVKNLTQTVLTETTLVTASTSKSFEEADVITLEKLQSDNSYKYIKITPQYVQGYTGIPAKGEFTLKTTGVNEIYNADQLAYVAKQVNNGVVGWDKASYKIMNDIDLSSYANWSPIGNNSKPFTGTFDGNGKKFTGLTINTKYDYIGLFGYVNEATIKNLVVENLSISGYNLYNSSRSNDPLSDQVGGLIGYSRDSIVTNSYTSGGTITGFHNVGGLIGYAENTNITCSYTTVDVIGNTYVGGLIGYFNYYGGTAPTVENTHATGAITGSWYVGGLIGFKSSGELKKSYAKGAVTGQTYVGGLIGKTSFGSVENTYATGNVTVGDFHGAIYVGGLIGYFGDGSLTNSYAIGKVTAGAVLDDDFYRYVGGLIGFKKGLNSVTSSYWDKDTSGLDNIGNFLIDTEEHYGTPKTTVEMKTQSTFTNWDFDKIWGIEAGSYPYLRGSCSGSEDEPADTTAPTLTAGVVNRTSETTATVKFTSTEGGTYYYKIGGAVTNTSTGGTALSTGETTINLTNLTAGEKVIYIVAKDAAGNTSLATFKITIPAYTYQVSGTVKDHNSNVLSGATVKLMAGQTQIGITVTTDANGEFIITNVPNGTYNLVVSKDDIVVTSIITVKNDDYAAGIITLPAGKTSSVVEVKGSEPPKIVVGNLDKQFVNTVQYGDKGVTESDMAVVTAGGAIVIKFVAEKKDITAANANDIISTAGTNNKTVGIFIDLSVLKTVTNTTGGAISVSLIGLNDLIDVYIPLDEAFQNKTDYIVYRYHGGYVESITTTANEDGEKIDLIDNNTTIKLTINKFSTYAIAYAAGTKPSNNRSSLPTINVEQTEGGKVAISTDKKTATITPDDAYVIGDVIIDGKSVGPVEEYIFKDSKNHTITGVFVKETALPYYLQNDKKIYIGFSVILGRSYKYIAPEGVTVKFRENPKTFKDNTIEWAKPHIDFVTERELFLGTSQDIFSPNTSMTRAMFVTVLGRLYERSYGIVPGTSKFSDVDVNAYYAKYVAWANESGVIKGIGNNKFAPDENVTREQMAVIMFNFAKLLDKADVTENSLAYTDSASISSWAIDGAIYCQETNIIKGRNSGNFAPQENATRAEVAAVVERLIKTIMK